MQGKDREKAIAIIELVDKVQEQVNNLTTRIPKAATALKPQVAFQQDADKPKLEACVKQLTDASKDMKSVNKELETLVKEGSKSKLLDACPDAKTFRAKVVSKNTVKFRPWYTKISSFSDNLIAVTGDANLFPGSKNEEIKATMNYIKTMKKYMKELDEKLKSA